MSFAIGVLIGILAGMLTSLVLKVIRRRGYKKE